MGIIFLQIFHSGFAYRHMWYARTRDHSNLRLEAEAEAWHLRLRNKSYTLLRWVFTRRLKAGRSYLSGKQLTGRFLHWFAVRTKYPDDRETVQLWGTWTRKECRVNTTRGEEHWMSIVFLHINHGVYSKANFAVASIWYLIETSSRTFNFAHLS